MHILLTLLTIAIFLNLALAVQKIIISRKIAAKSEPYVQSNPKSKFKVLFIGDSTAVGTGAQMPIDSVAGRLGSRFPQISIENIGKNGDKIEDLIPKLKNLSGGQYNLIIIQAGGNNILQFTNVKKFERDLEVVIDLAKEKGDAVALITTGNVGLAPFFPRPIGYLYSQRTKKIRSIAQNLAKNEGVIYVDLFEQREKDPFAKDPEKYHAADMLHPSSEGYRIWFERLMEELEKNAVKIPG
jgi:lysophospholipase L1-like esterase